jgi:hypothetical protein
MQTNKKTISPLLYYNIISILTTAVFLIVGIVSIILFSGKAVTNLVIIIAVFFLLWKGAIVAFGVRFFSESQTRDFLVRFLGAYHGRFYGLILGALLGAGIAKLLNFETFAGSILGALPFYFLGRWVGTKVSSAIGGQLEKIFVIPEFHAQENVSQSRSPKKAFLIVTIMALPWLLVLVAWMMEYFQIPIDYLTELLSVARIFVIGLSVFVIGYPWLMRTSWLKKYSSNSSSLTWMTSWLGMFFSIVPSFYGFILCLLMGASIFELCLFTLASSIAATVWIIFNPMPSEEKTV